MIVDPDDPLFDPTFVACRDERCTIVGLHHAHRVPVGRGRQCRACPVCNGPIVRIPRKRVSCSRCSWGLTYADNHKDSQHA